MKTLKLGVSKLIPHRCDNSIYLVSIYLKEKSEFLEKYCTSAAGLVHISIITTKFCSQNMVSLKI